MPAPNRRTFGELLRDSEQSARLGLLEVSGERAPSMLRALKPVVHAGARLWTAASPYGFWAGPGPDPMAQLMEITWAIQLEYRSGLWPDAGVADERLLATAGNFTDAVDLVDQARSADRTQSGPGPADSWQDVQRQVAHTLYLEAHGLRLALAQYAADVTHQLAEAVRRRTPHHQRPDPDEPTAALTMAGRVDLVERLAGHLAVHHRQPMSAPERPGAGSQLAVALARWDIQAHRSLATGPNAANVALAARVQALITTTACEVVEAAAAHAHIDKAVASRFTPQADASQLAWTKTAVRWTELATAHSRTDPSLVGAASELRTTMVAILQAQPGRATPNVIAGRLNLPAALNDLNLAVAAGIDLSQIIRTVAITEPTLTAPARIIGMRTQSEVERTADRGESRYLGVEWVTPRQIRDNTVIPLPEPARRGLVDLADQTTTITSSALSAFILPDRPPTTIERAQPILQSSISPNTERCVNARMTAVPSR